jgi:hypothetical protein
MGPLYKIGRTWKVGDCFHHGPGMKTPH